MAVVLTQFPSQVEDVTNKTHSKSSPFAGIFRVEEKTVLMFAWVFPLIRGNQ